MSAYFIFVIISTVILFCWYGMKIWEDMYGFKNKPETDEDNIEIPVTEEEPTVIEEEEQQHEVADDTTDDTHHESMLSNSEDSDGAKSQEEGMQIEPEVVIYDPEHPDGISSKEKMRRAELGFEDVDVESTGGITEVDFREMLKKCTPSHPAIRIKYDKI